ncbi:MAG: DUF6324 family protein [Pseudomonadota bacterium]
MPRHRTPRTPPRRPGEGPGGRRRTPDAPRPAPQDPPAQQDALAPDEAGALRIGATDQGMVRLILTTPAGVVDLDFAPEDAEEIAEELRAAAAAVRR